MAVTADGQQTITEICDDCKCHVRDLTVDDILVKGNNNLIFQDSRGNEVTRKEHDHQTCKCETCNNA
jgi:hypothetical protein